MDLFYGSQREINPLARNYKQISRFSQGKAGNYRILKKLAAIKNAAHFLLTTSPSDSGDRSRTVGSQPNLMFIRIVKLFGIGIEPL